jgi:hypothetical protein
VQDHRLGGALGVEHLQHLPVRVPVVDDQRLAVALGDRDVRPEADLLRGPALVAGAERVQPGLADPAHPRLGGHRLDLPKRLVEVVQPRRLVGVQGHRGQHPVVTGGQVGAPARGRHVDADLHDAVDAHLGGRGEQGVDRLGAGLLDGDVQVGVAVEHRHGQRFGRGRELPGAAGGAFLSGTHRRPA